MLTKLKSIKDRFVEIESLLIKEDIISNHNLYTKLCKEHRELEKIVFNYDQYESMTKQLKEVKELLNSEKDQDFRELIKQELIDIEKKIENLELELKQLLIPKDPNDSRNIVLEIRAGTGGDEAGIFAGDLFRMYQRFAENQSWKFSVLDFLESSSGGYKEIICSVAGNDVYGVMKYESGVHRVQRVPATETQGRIHTSAASVIVMPEMDDLDITIDMNDVRKDTFCSSGPGGQSVNTTYSAIRLTHIPTGVVVSCQDEKSQVKNFEKALKVLRTRLYDIEYKKQKDAITTEKKSLIGKSDRSDKIRTYNYPQGRVTDHRIKFTVYNLLAFIDGDIMEMIEELRIVDNAEKLQAN